MKLFTFVLLLLSSTLSFASANSAELAIPAEVNSSSAPSIEDELAQYPWQSSYTQCSAYTSCYDNWGNYIGTVSCYVYGSQWSSVYGVSENYCEWRVIPGVAVGCRGYVKQQDYYGRVWWAWQTYSYRCPGR